MFVGSKLGSNILIGFAGTPATTKLLNVLNYYRTSSNHNVLTYYNVRQYCCICSYSRKITNLQLFCNGRSTHHMYSMTNLTLVIYCRVGIQYALFTYS